jgi:hypothetical protein
MDKIYIDYGSAAEHTLLQSYLEYVLSKAKRYFYTNKAAISFYSKYLFVRCYF